MFQRPATVRPPTGKRCCRILAGPRSLQTSSHGQPSSLNEWERIKWKSGKFRLAICFLKIFLNLFSISKGPCLFGLHEDKARVSGRQSAHWGPPCKDALSWCQVRMSGIQKREREPGRFCPDLCIEVSACFSTLTTAHAECSLKPGARKGSSSLCAILFLSPSLDAEETVMPRGSSASQVHTLSIED